MLQWTTNWPSLNDGRSETYAYNSAVANSYMELDFGAGGKETTSVRVGQCTDMVMTRLNGIKLSILDETRSVLFEYTFAGIASNAPAVYHNFNISASGMQHTTIS